VPDAPEFHPNPWPPQGDHPDWHHPGNPDEPLVIINENDFVLRFLADGRTVELAPGTAEHLPGGRIHVIKFHRGGKFGTATYELPPGAHAFVPTDAGWDLIRVEPERPPNRPPQRHDGVPKNPLW
jgi:hypothetical protein